MRVHIKVEHSSGSVQEYLAETVIYLSRVEDEFFIGNFKTIEDVIEQLSGRDRNLEIDWGEEDDRYVWVVRENNDKTEGRGPMVDHSVHTSEEEAFEANKKVSGTMGYPRTLGGEIWKVTLGTYPLQQEMVFGSRVNWLGKHDEGWLDLRDQPNEEDPDWIEFKRLKEKFEPGVI